MRRLKDRDKEFEYLRRYSFGANVTKIIVELIRFGAFVLVAYYVKEMIGDLAGKETIANINISIWDKALGAIFGGGGIWHGSKQKNLRKQTVERLQKRIIELESKIDNNRSSSNLTPIGDTNPEDL